MKRKQRHYGVDVLRVELQTVQQLVDAMDQRTGVPLRRNEESFGDIFCLISWMRTSPQSSLLYS